MQKIIGYHGTKSKNVDSILNILDLDKPFALKQFKEYQEALEEQFINQGIVLDFSKGIGKSAERIRCFWMDAVKEAYNI